MQKNGCKLFFINKHMLARTTELNQREAILHGQCFLVIETMVADCVPVKPILEKKMRDKYYIMRKWKKPCLPVEQTYQAWNEPLVPGAELRHLLDHHNAQI